MDKSAPRRHRALAAASVCVLLSIGGIAAGLVAGPERMLGSHLLEDTVAAFAWSALAVTWAVRGRASWTVLVIAAAWAVAAASNGWSLIGHPAAAATGWLATWTWAAAVGLSFTVGVLLSRHRRLPRGLTAAATVSTLLMASSFAALPTTSVEHGTDIPNPLGLTPSAGIAVVAALCTTALSFVAMATLAVQMTSPARRRRTVPVLIAAIAGIVGLGAGALANDWAPLVQVLTTPLLPIALAITPSGTPSRSVRSVGALLESAADPASALRSALAVIARDLGLPGLAIEVGGAIVASVGQPGTRRIPLNSLGRLEGYVLAPQTDAADDDQLAAVLAPLTGVLASMRLVEEVHRSRAELVVAREDERRRTRRDLHDEVGPLLAAAVVQADVASLALERSPERARESLIKAKMASSEAVHALRRIAHDLTPSAVDDLGLLGALDDLAGRLSGTARVTVTAARLPSLPAAVEVALYRIAAEAAGNAIRHGSPSCVRIRVDAGGGEMALSVADDGTGFDPERTTLGVGLASMSERATALGGDVRITSGTSGTVVRARIPVRR